MDFKYILDFLRELKTNNKSVWFEQNRETYQEARGKWLDITQQLIVDLHDLNPEFAHLDPRKCIYRINRDTRFGTNKSPYKTNFGTFIVPGGKMTGLPGYYLHLEPDNCFLAAGIHCPEKEQLTLIRDHILEKGAQLDQALKDKTLAQSFGELRGQKLKRGPKGYDLEHQFIEYLKMKDFLLIQNIPESEVLKKDFPRYAATQLRKTKKFVDFLQHSLQS